MRVWTHFFLFFFLSNTSTWYTIVNMWCDIFRSKMLLLLVFFQLFFLASSFHWKDLLLSQLNPLNPEPSIVRILSLRSDGFSLSPENLWVFSYLAMSDVSNAGGVSKTNTLHLPKNTFRNLYPFFRYTNFFVLNSKLFKKQVNCSKNNREVFQKFLELF